MRVYFLFSICFIVSSGTAFCQSNPDQVEVRKVVESIFLAMQKSDSTMLHAAFTREVTLATIVNGKDSSVKIEREYSIQEFLVAVATPHKEIWYEETWDYDIRIDGHFAQVWCKYAFYLDNTFSHCGVDAFQLIKEKYGWKIFHLADTRRKENCVIPQDIDKKHS